MFCWEGFELQTMLNLLMRSRMLLISGIRHSVFAISFKFINFRFKRRLIVAILRSKDYSKLSAEVATKTAARWCKVSGWTNLELLTSAEFRQESNLRNGSERVDFIEAVFLYPELLAVHVRQ